MANYTKNEKLKRLAQMTVLQVAAKVNCFPQDVYKYLNGDLSRTSKIGSKIYDVIGEADDNVSIKRKYGKSGEEIARLAGVSPGSVYMWYDKQIVKELMRTSIDKKIESAIAALEAEREEKELAA